jgi:predicted transcriptional regulator
MQEVRQTSLMAYDEIKADGTASSQRKRIYELIRDNPDGLTREEIRDLAGIMYTSVCGRVRSLVKSGLLFENEHSKRLNASGKMAYILKAYEG